MVLLGHPSWLITKQHELLRMVKIGVPTVKSLIKILTQCFASQIKVRGVSFGGFE
jgi:hypothetical protein